MNFASKKAAAASRPFLAEAMERMLDDEGRARAQAVFEGAAAQIPEFMRYRMTPQTPPYHAEGATLAAHVERVLAAVLAIEAGASVSIDVLHVEASVVGGRESSAIREHPVRCS